MIIRSAFHRFLGLLVLGLFGCFEDDLKACSGCNSGPEKKGVEIDFEYRLGNGINSYTLRTSVPGAVKPLPPQYTLCSLAVILGSPPSINIYDAKFSKSRPVEVEVDKPFSIVITAGDIGTDGQTEQVLEFTLWTPACYGMKFGEHEFLPEHVDKGWRTVDIGGLTFHINARSTKNGEKVVYDIGRSPVTLGDMDTTIPCMLITESKKGEGGASARSSGPSLTPFGANTGPAPDGRGMADAPSFVAEVSLGDVSETEILGSIYWTAETLADAALPSSLLYVSAGSASAGNDVIEASGALRQVNTENGLVDIESDTDELTLNFYHSEDVGSKVSGLYTTTGDPFKTITITKDGSSVSYVIESDSTVVANYTLTTPSSGEFVVLNNLLEREDSYFYEESGDEKSETHSVSDTSGTSDELLFSEKRTYTAFPWGDELTEEVSDPDGENRVTTHAFYGDNDGVTSSDAYYGEEKSVTYPDGSWVFYEYNSSGRVSKEYRPWKDSPATASLATGTTTHLTEYTYSSGKLTSEVVKVLGVETDRTTYVYTTGTQSGSGAALNIETVTRTPAGGPETVEVTRTFDDGGRIESIDYADERRDSYIYENGEYDAGMFTVTGTGAALRTTVTRGTVTEPEGIANRTTREITIEDENGNTVSEETLVYTDEEEYERLNLTLHSYEEDGTHTGTTKDGRVTYGASYDDQGRVIIEADEQGITTEYTYIGRNIATSTKKGVPLAVISSGTYAAQPDIVTTYEYDLLGRQVSEVVSSGTNSLPARTTTYTVSGDVKTQSEGGFTTTYYYEYGGRYMELQLPNGTTHETFNYLDGRVHWVMGASAVHQFYDYGVNPADEEDDYEDGTLWSEVRLGDDESPRVEKTITDGSGRLLRIEKPTFDGTGLNLVESEYNSKGQLIKEARTGMADTLYEYDELGRQSRMGLDMDLSGTLTPASIDRLTDSEEKYWKEEEGAPWMAVHYRTTYLTDNSGTSTHVYGSEVQLNNFSGSRTGKAEVYNGIGNTISIEEIDRGQRLLKQENETPHDSDINAVATYRNGLLQSQNTAEIEKPTKFTYDAFGREIGRTPPQTNIATTTTYDAATGQIASVVSGTNGPSISYEYYGDGVGANSGKLKKVTQNGYATYYSWTQRGELYRQWGAAYPVEYSYNAYGQLKTMKTYQGPVDHDNPSMTVWTGTAWPVTTGTANVTTWEYNEATGLLAAKRDAASEEVTYTYNNANQLASRTLARGATTTYGYNAAGDLTGKSYSDATPLVSISYNRRGLPATITDGGGVRTRTYTKDGQLDQEAYVSGMLPSGWVLDRNYGTSATAGKLANLSLSAASVPVYSGTYGYNGNGTLHTAQVSLAANLPKVTYNVGTEDSTNLIDIEFTYASFDFFKYETYFDVFDRFLGTWADYFAAPDPFGGVVFWFNANGQYSRRFKVDGDDYWDYSYNARGELEDATYYLTSGFPSPSDLFQWNYDNIGNRFESLVNSSLTTYGANELNQYTEIESPGGTRTMTHDADGNITEDGQWTYTWDAENRLVSVQTSATAVSGGATPKKLVFTYDSENRRISKTALTWSGSTFSGTASHKLFLYDGMRMIAEVGFSGTTPVVAKSYYWGLDLAGMRDGHSMDAAGGIGGIWMMQSGTTAVYPMYDPMGNTIALAKAGTSEKVGAYDYMPFGGIENIDGAMAEEFPFRFSTKYHDDETGLIDFGYRFYNPETGRWLNRDPIGEDGGVNLYGYVGNDPVNDWDLLGLLSDADVFNDLLVHWWTSNGNAPFIRNSPGYGKWAMSFDNIRIMARVAFGSQARVIGNGTIFDGEYVVRSQRTRLDRSQWMIQSLNEVSFGFGGRYTMDKSKCKITFKRNRFHISDRGDFDAFRYKLTDIPGAVAGWHGRWMNPAHWAGAPTSFQDFPILIQWGGPDLIFEMNGKGIWKPSPNSGWPFGEK